MSTTDTERDERLREARVAASVYREAISRGMYTEVKPEQRRVLDLDAEVARLDAVVTAVREVHQPRRRRSGERVIVCECCLLAYPCPTVRALDGGAR